MRLLDKNSWWECWEYGTEKPRWVEYLYDEDVIEKADGKEMLYGVSLLKGRYIMKKNSIVYACDDIYIKNNFVELED